MKRILAIALSLILGVSATIILESAGFPFWKRLIVMCGFVISYQLWLYGLTRQTESADRSGQIEVERLKES